MIEPFVILNDRYPIIKPLAESQYTRTYLARDTYRFDEFCVIKELRSLAESPSDRAKRETQFQQEAQILYQLNHPQIPRFSRILSGRNCRTERIILRPRLYSWVYLSGTIQAISKSTKILQ